MEGKVYTIQDFEYIPNPVVTDEWVEAKNTPEEEKIDEGTETRSMASENIKLTSMLDQKLKKY